jgi:hypothetical protein
VFSSPYGTSAITTGCWSPTRPGVLVMAQADGSVHLYVQQRVCQNVSIRLRIRCDLTHGFELCVCGCVLGIGVAARQLGFTGPIASSHRHAAGDLELHLIRQVLYGSRTYGPSAVCDCGCVCLRVRVLTRMYCVCRCVQLLQTYNTWRSVTPKVICTFLTYRATCVAKLRARCVLISSSSPRRSPVFVSRAR